ncbi:MAG TPA: tRNA (cytosine(32)/uridine(32)-2'-O)-methyltransferase TrmJ [Gammaproteobacteria bacterium]|nr:tRNA (cytosine(32)/uridine(32)-2'-O)-methyltransferase TrmJ [Gammaproteobacteria bacterium]
MEGARITNPADRVRIVLVGTTHSGNVGATARAMKTMGLSRLWLVASQCEIDDQAMARASGATDVLEAAQRVATLDEALADCRLVMGTTARLRTLDLPALTPHRAAEQLAAEAGQGDVALIFGPERTGLANSDLDRCHYRVTIPANPDYSSLNLAAAVQVLCYELQLALNETGEPESEDEEAPPAGADEMERFYAHLESVLLASDFLDPDNPRHLMRRLRRLFNRARPDQNEINILRGILTAVAPQARENRPPDARDDWQV